MSRTSVSCVQPSPLGGSLVRSDADDLAVRPVPDGDAVAPPQLARDAPVVHVVDPVEVALGHLLRGGSCTRPSRTASPAACASGPTLTHHCMDSRGSMVVLQREQCPTECVYGRFSATIRPCARRAATMAERASKRSRPWNGPWTVMTPRSSMTVSAGRSCRWPIAKSFGSCAGVTLTAPVPNSGSTCVVRDDRDRTVGERQLDPLADQVRVPLVVGVDRDRGVTEHRLGAGGRDDDGVLALAVPDGDQLAVVVLVLHLDVGDGRQAARAPVDDALGAVDQPVVVAAA